MTVAPVTDGDREPASIEDLWRALHECGHGLAAIQLGFEVGAITLRDPDRGGVGGACYVGQTLEHDVPIPTFEQGQSTLMWAWETRSWFEKRYALITAGPIAMEMYGSTTNDYRPPGVVELERQRVISELEDAGFGELVAGEPPTAPLAAKSDRSGNLNWLGSVLRMTVSPRRTRTT